MATAACHQDISLSGEQDKTKQQTTFIFFFPMAAYAMDIVCIAQLGLCGVLSQNVLPA